MAGLLLSPGEARDRLTSGIFTSSDLALRQGQIEQAFELAAKVAPLERTLRDARRAGLLQGLDRAARIDEAVAEGILDVDQAAQLHRMDELRRLVIMVDSFEGYGRQHALRSHPRKKPAIYAV